MSATGSSSYIDNNLQKEMRAYRRAELVLQFGNMIAFGMSLVLFVVGLLYVTVYYYEYSFSAYSINLVAGFYITLGIILFCVALASIFTLKPDGQPFVLAGYIFVLIIAFIVLIILGSVGLGMKASNELYAESQMQMQNIMREYDNRNLYKYHTKKIDWLQKRFSCCGLNSYLDWKTQFYNGLYGGPGVVINNPSYVNQWDFNNKNPYGNTIPDSCCVNMSPGCGRQVEQMQSGVGVHPHGQRGNYYYTAGCASAYYNFFSKDVNFLGALSITISLFLLLCLLILSYGYLLTKNVSSYTDKNVRTRQLSGGTTNSTVKRVVSDDEDEEKKSFVKANNNQQQSIRNNLNKTSPSFSDQRKIYKDSINDTLNNARPAPAKTVQPILKTTTQVTTSTAKPYYINDDSKYVATRPKNNDLGTNYSQSSNVGSYYTSGLNYYK